MTNDEIYDLVTELYQDVERSYSRHEETRRPGSIYVSPHQGGRFLLKQLATRAWFDCFMIALNAASDPAKDRRAWFVSKLEQVRAETGAFEMQAMVLEDLANKYMQYGSNC